MAADFSGNGTVDAPDLDIWKTGFGTVNTATQSTGDSDGDMDVDGADFLEWQRTLGQSTIPPVAPKEVEAAAVGATSIRVDWQASPTATSYSIQRRRPDTETEFTTIASGVVATTYTDGGLASDTLYEYRVVAHRNPQSTPSQPAQATTNQSNLTAYRPQALHPIEDPADAPIYDTFPRRPVREQDESSNTHGPGIRINHDDDDFSGVADVFESGTEIPRENDLIEVKIDRLPGLGNLVLIAGSPLRLYYNHDKETPIPLDGGATEPLPFVNNTLTVFVEWTGSTHGFANLSLVEPNTLTTLDSARFHSFRSLIVAFGGNGQDPADTDGDGSIGDPVEGPNREGIFDVAQSLYDTGWDVLAFNQNEENLGVDVPTTEILSARQQRFVQRHAVIGYSYGGGATHDLIEGLYSDDNDFNGDPDSIITDLGVYLDAVDQFGTNAENDWPDVALYVLNIYEDNSVLNGADINDGDVTPGAILEEVNTTTHAGWDHNLDHFTIDDNPQVQALIGTRILQRIQNR